MFIADYNYTHDGTNMYYATINSTKYDFRGMTVKEFQALLDGDPPGDPPQKKAYKTEDYGVDKINDIGPIAIMPRKRTISRGVRLAIIPGVGGYVEIGFGKSNNSNMIGKPYISVGWGVGVEAGISYITTLYVSTERDIVEVEEMQGWENSYNLGILIGSLSKGSNYKNWDNYSNKISRKYYDTYSGGLGLGIDGGFSFTKGYTWVIFKNW